MTNTNAPPRPKPEPWLSKKEDALHYGFSTRWVEYRLAEGMPHRKIGGAIRFQLSEVDAWLEGRR
jgi:hypothetical protein